MVDRERGASRDHAGSFDFSSHEVERADACEQSQFRMIKAHYYLVGRIEWNECRSSNHQSIIEVMEENLEGLRAVRSFALFSNADAHARTHRITPSYRRPSSRTSFLDCRRVVRLCLRSCTRSGTGISNSRRAIRITSQSFTGRSSSKRAFSLFLARWASLR